MHKPVKLILSLFQLTVVVIGYDSTTHQVAEGDGSVRICASVRSGQLGTSVDMTSSTADVDATG